MNNEQSENIRHGESRATPTDQQWEPVLDAMVTGNNLLPQAFMAQGVLGAYAMALTAEELGLSLDSFIVHDPRKTFLTKRLATERRIAHERSSVSYGNPTPIPGRRGSLVKILLNVWRDDKETAVDFLAAVSNFVYATQTDSQSPPGTIRMLDAVRRNPLFLGLLKSAADIFSDENVVRLSDDYNARIRAFSERVRRVYLPVAQSGQSVVSDYTRERLDLADYLNNTLEIIASRIRSAMIQYLKEHGARDAVLEIVQDSDTVDLFGLAGSRVKEINPLAKYGQA